MVTIVLYTEKLGIPYWLCIYLCNWNLTMYPVWDTWRLPPGTCSNHWNHSGTSELQSRQFYTFSVSLDWHWHTLDILCINIIRYLQLCFSYRCLPWTWIQEWYCYLFDDVHLMNRLLLFRPLIYFILPYICNNIWSTFIQMNGALP